MARFYGKIGFAVTGETRPGVWMNTIVERPYFGTLNRVVARDQSADKVNNDLVFNIKYVKFMGAKWNVSAVQMQRPRLILNMGDVYKEEEDHGGQT